MAADSRRFGATGTCNVGDRRTGAVIWLTGLSGAGKSTIGEALCERLQRAGDEVEYLDGDAIRAVFPQTGFSPSERDAHVRRVAFVASLLERHGVVVVVALISPYVRSRAFAREMCRSFVEVHVSTSLEVCEARDVKGLWARARRGEIASFTGLDDPYEPPPSPELVIDTARTSVADAVQKILGTLERTRLKVTA